MKIQRWQLLANLIGFLFLSIPIFSFLSGNSANPVQLMTIRTGRSAIALIILTLACTPLNTIFGLTFLLKARKVFGIYAFLLSTLHFLTFFGLDYKFNLNWVIPELLGKLFLQVGILALFLLFLLAITSISFIKRKLKNFWKPFQKLTYLAGMLAILHLALALKGDYLRLVIPLTTFLALMAMRFLPISRFRLLREISVIKKVNDFLMK